MSVWEVQKENAMLARPGTPFPSGPENGDESLLLSQSRASQVRLPAQARSLLCGTCSRPADPRCGRCAFYAAICWHPCCLVVRLAGPRTAGSGMFGGNGPCIHNSSATLKPDCSMRLSGGNRAVSNARLTLRWDVAEVGRVLTFLALQTYSNTSACFRRSS